MNALLIWGASGHASVVADIVRLDGEYEIVGFLDDVNPERRGEMFCGAPILGGREAFDEYLHLGVRHILLAFGDCGARYRLSRWVQTQGFSLATAVHPGATVAASAIVGAGTVVVAGAVINPKAQIGESVIVNTGATVDHECTLGDAVHVCPGAHLGGQVTIGEATWIGIGAVVKDRVCIGKHSVVGAGAVVVDDIPDGVVSYGVPSRVVRSVIE